MMVECEHLSASVQLDSTEVSKIDPLYWACSGVCNFNCLLVPVIIAKLIFKCGCCYGLIIIFNDIYDIFFVKSMQITKKSLDLPDLWSGTLWKVGLLSQQAYY